MPVLLAALSCPDEAVQLSTLSCLQPLLREPPPAITNQLEALFARLLALTCSAAMVRSTHVRCMCVFVFGSITTTTNHAFVSTPLEGENELTALHPCLVSPAASLGKLSLLYVYPSCTARDWNGGGFGEENVFVLLVGVAFPISGAESFGYTARR